MSDHDWSKEALFDSPHVRHEIEQAIKIERPPSAEAARIAARLVPVQNDLRAILDNPQLAEQLWQQVGEPETARPALPAQRPDDSQAAVQLGLALYYLHALHFQGKPGHEHLIDDRRQPREDEDEDLGAEPA